MAVKTSGTPLALSEVQTEFGGANPISLSEYYRGAGLVPSGPSQNAGIAASGTITLGSFYGSVRAFVFSPTISANTTNYNLKASAIAAGWDQATPLLATVTINGGIVVGASSTGAFAFDTGVTFPAGSSLKLINNGTIVGKGGAGGAGGYGSNSGQPGGGGGPALRAQAALSVTNNGTIAGAGGGGGGGGGYYYWYGDEQMPGGGTWVSDSGSTGGYGAGWLTTGYASQITNGGGLGGAGGSGPTGNSMGGATAGGGGGGPGSATSGNGNITWVATGTRYGALN